MAAHISAPKFTRTLGAGSRKFAEPHATTITLNHNNGTSHFNRRASYIMVSAVILVMKLSEL